ncbi:hypothetical protein LG401_18245 [Bacillus pumilus]|uniref:hypothetical protein n=1 Tax=Bacillus TaxID=1386 RepID=UPI001CFADDBD|nr:MULTISPECIES: hypothetical protein [Bacillus]MED4810914.1 hypothetical protein [Bacillus atrophaeus]MED4858791.1 hypothetical protein [Bacillus atrophaeus]UCZ70931.1 hypothetical protein LG401_18245 [Bacillus pumilus]
MAELNQERNFETFLEEASWFWSSELIGEQQEHTLAEEMLKISPLIQDTLENHQPHQLVSVLKVLRDEQENLVPRSLILKNLMILLDVSAEILDRVALYCHHKNVTQLNGPFGQYQFKKFGPNFTKALSNDNIYKLAVSDDGFFEDVINLMLYAHESNEFSRFLTFKGFRLATLVGNIEALAEFYLSRSIENSSQIKQLRAVSYGNGLQNNLKHKIVESLTEFGVEIAPGNRYLGEQQFDLVLVKRTESQIQTDWKWVVIETAFQETTNSVIERKAKQAVNGLYQSIDEANHKLVYIIDGAGFVKRYKVTSTIFDTCHFASTANPEHFEKLITFLKEYFSN